ncbi:MAG TPA: hypothetical protein VL282_11165 [Tepidisphaeraceae bacterium]|jgi:hypothetical protein|nr:hypothetical protein [Tepidisphaeraceae bacterium]
MNIGTKPKIVLLGMMTKMPVAGVVWQTVHYLIGLQRLGYEPWYVEAHARTPSMFMKTEQDDGSRLASNFIADVMRRFDLADRWAYHALHDDGAVYGMTENALNELYKSAAMIINLHGGTQPRPEHYATNRLIYLETDPVLLQIELFQKDQYAIDFLSPHIAFFTFGENIGRPDCKLPVSERFPFKPTRQPVVTDLWQKLGIAPGANWTTIGNWQQEWRPVHFQGETYHWSKHYEFMKCIDLPSRTKASFELALASYGPDDQKMLESKGWNVTPALDFSTDLDAYRGYIAGSHGEFTVAKDQNVRLRSGWFSDRSATYLAAGRPVITQDTGFGNMLPTGKGLFAFTDTDQIVDAIQRVESDYEGNCRAAADLAQDHFNYDVVLKPILREVGLS